MLCKATAFEIESQAFLFSLLHLYIDSKCTPVQKVSSALHVFFIFYKSQVTRGPRKQKRASCGSIFFFCLRLSLVSIYSHVQSTHSLSALFTTTTLALQTERRHRYRSSSRSKPVSTASPHSFFSLFFHSLQKFDVYITNFSATAVAFFETAAAEVRQRADKTWGSVFKSQKR